MVSFDLEAFLLSGALLSLNQNEVLIGWGNLDWKNEPSRYPVWYAPDFFLRDEKPYLHFDYVQEMPVKELLEKLPSPKKSLRLFDPVCWEAFDSFFQKFMASSLEKSVPYVQKKARFPTSHDFVAHSLRGILNYHQKAPQATAYGFWNREEGMIGATPELLLSLEEKKLHTVACAGTALDASMQSHPKLKREHELVIQGLKSSLVPFGEVDVGPTTTKRFSHLIHLVTNLQLQHQIKAPFSELIQSLHPTAALGTFPKAAGRVYLEEYESCLPRKRFGAPFGILTAEDKASIYVAIRNIQWASEEKTIFAGSGILKESLYPEEQAEILSKLQAIDEILGITT